MSYSWDQVIAWLGLVIPLAALAWSAVKYVQNQKRAQQFREFEKFRDLMKQLGAPGVGVLGQMAVTYELRKFPQYKDVIIRSLESTSKEEAIRGEGAKLLISECQLTINELREK